MEKLKRTLEGNELAVEEFLRRTKTEKTSPVIVAMEIMKKYSGDIHIFFSALPIDEIKQGYSGNIVGRIGNMRCVDYEKEGKQRRRCMGFLDDDKGKLSFTIFDPSYPYTRGDLILIKDAQVGEYSDKPYLTLSGRSQITILEKSNNVDASSQTLKVKDLKPDMYGVNIKGTMRVLGAKENTGSQGVTLYSGVLTDDTGNVGVKSWGIELEDGSVEITGGSVKQYQDRLYINLGKGGNLKMISRKNEIFTTLEQLIGSEKGKVSGTAVITKVFTKNLTVDVCSVCGKVLREMKCPKHPEAQVNTIIRISAVLDDGTASPTVYIYQKYLEGLINGGEETIEKAIINGDVEGISRQLEEALTSKIVYFSLYGFRGTQNYYAEIEELKVLTDADLKERYDKLMEEIE